MAPNLCNIVNLLTIMAACNVFMACGVGNGTENKESKQEIKAESIENSKPLRKKTQEDSTDQVFNPDDSLLLTKPNIGDQLEVDFQDSLDSVAFIEDLYSDQANYDEYNDSLEALEPEVFDDIEEYEIFNEQEPGPEDNFAESRLVQSTLVKVIRPGNRDTFDSVLVDIEDRLSIRPDPGADQVVLEKWISPVNYKGYKFNRRKLMLYGVQAHQPVGVFHYQDDYYFSLGSKMYVLQEHFDYKPFVILQDSLLTKYLLSHDRPF